MVIISSSGNNKSDNRENTNGSETCVFTTSNPVPVTHGGLEAGTKINGKNVCQILETILFPYQYPRFDTFYMENQETILEIGDKVTGGSRTFKWTIDNNKNIKKNSIYIKDVNENKILASDLENDGEESINIGDDKILTESGVYTWEIGGENTKNEKIIKTFQVNWYYRIYWGESEKNSLTEDDIKNLTHTELKNVLNGSYEFNVDEDNKFFYVVYPKDWGEISKWTDLDTSLPVDYTYNDDIDITNDYGVTVTYKVLRTTYKQGSKLRSELLL